MLRPALFIAALLAATAAVAAGPRDTMLVTSDWLAQHLNDANLVILHAGAQGDYTAGHIPGARLAPQDALSASAAASGGLSLELPTSGDLQFKMTEFGISDNSRIVVYANRQTETATRLVLALDSAGFGDKTVLLDGGLADWRRTNHATSTEVPAAKQGRVSGFTLRPTTVDVNTLRSRMGRPGTVVIDARAPVFYDGVQAGMATTKRGHIPGAKNIPYTSVTGTDGKLKPEAELRALFTAAGVKPGDKIIAYCHVGQQATAVVFAARSLGIEAQLYDGSFQDWAARDYPVEGPPAAAAG